MGDRQLTERDRDTKTDLDNNECQLSVAADKLVTPHSPLRNPHQKLTIIFQQNARSDRKIGASCGTFAVCIHILKKLNMICLQM